MPSAIIVDNVWKQYIIGRARYSSLRDTLVGGWRRMLGRPTHTETERTREFDALKGVSFEVEQGSTLGIIGPNGAGKSTLLKVLSRVTQPTRGIIATHGRVSALIEVGAGFHPELTGRENVYLNGSILGMTRKEVNSKLDAIIDFSGLEEFIDTPVKYYSSGMYVRLGFSVAAHTDPEILLVDEVLSVGDFAFRKKCLDAMARFRESGTTVVFVSHNLEAVANLCKRTLLLAHGKMLVDTETSKAIAHYFQASSAALQGQSPKDTEARLVQIAVPTITNLSRPSNQEFCTGDTIQVSFKADITSPVNALAFGFIVKEAGGRPIFDTTSERLGLPTPAISRRDLLTVTFRIRLNLLGGTYHISLHASDAEGGECYTYRDAISTFLVRDGSTADGVVDLSPTCRIEAGQS